MTLLWRLAAGLFTGMVVIIVADGQHVVVVVCERAAFTSTVPAHRIATRCRGPPPESLRPWSVTSRCLHR